MMSRSKSRPVALSRAERGQLRRLVRTGSPPAQQVRRARILLELDENDPDRDGPVPTQEVVAQRVGVHVDTVAKTSRAYADRGGDVTARISRMKRLTAPVEPKVTGEVEARLIALACSAPPEGHARWSLRLLEKQVARTDDLPDLDHSTIGKVLKRGRCVLICRSAGPSHPRPTQSSSPGWRTSSASTPAPVTRRRRWCAWTRSPTSSSGTLVNPSPPPRVATAGRTPSTCAVGRARSSAGSSPWRAGGASAPDHGAPGSTGRTRSSICSPPTTPAPSESSW